MQVDAVAALGAVRPDDKGRAYAVAPCPRADLLVLHYVPDAA